MSPRDWATPQTLVFTKTPGHKTSPGLCYTIPIYCWFSHDVTKKFKLKNYRSYRDFTFTKHSRFCSKTRKQMFLLVSVRHVGAHPGELQHGVSIQISTSLGKTFLRISRIRNIPLTWILAWVFVYVPPFISQTLVFIYWTVLIFILIYFEWRDTENQQ